MRDGDRGAPAAGREPAVVIVNQHGDNRGDEAAMRAMVRRIAAELPGCRFTVVHQFADPGSEVDPGVPVTYLPLRLPAIEAARLVLFAALRAAGLEVRRLPGRRGRRVVEAYRRARLVVSAPGGPYFGDTYSNHEVVHWFYVWLAVALSRPVVLYAPSVGPFRHRLLNPLRRRGFRWFESVTLREEISAGMLRELTGGTVPAEVTADSALQEGSATASRDGWVPDGDPGLLLVVSVRRPGGGRDAAHDDAVVAALRAACRRVRLHVVFLPQLHGPRHRDQPYLEALARRVEGAASVRVVAEDRLDSDGQRALVAAADLVIAGRYHPAVFSVAAATPVLVIPYEHKAWGLAEAAGIDAWAVDVSEAAGDRLAVALDRLLDSLDEVRGRIEARRDGLVRAARRSTAVALAALGGP